MKLFVWDYHGVMEKGNEKAANELIKEDILISKPTSYGLHVSLNPRKREEINQYLK